MNVSPEGHNDTLHFVVTDTGIGISSDRIDRIFESFTQAESSTSRRFGGTGLGTTISKQLVELMGGRIWAESKVGKGSTFHFTLPMQRTDLPVEKVPAFDISGIPSRSGRRLRILLTEDVEENIALAEIRLEQQGHDVVVARNGREAVDRFREGGIDLILMDVHMPDMDGIEATRRIRALEGNSGKHTPIIATTASVMTADQDNCLKEGMDAVVGKPIDFSALFAAIERLAPKGPGGPVAKPVSAKAPAADVRLPPLKGVDVALGLSTWRDPEVYGHALLSFSGTYRSAATDLARLIERQDQETAQGLVHKLKGVAGNLSVMEVYAAASKINEALKDKRIDDVRPAIGSLANALEVVVESIGQLEHIEKEEEPRRKALDPMRVSNLFKKMLLALEQFNPDAVEPYLNELRSYLPEQQTALITKQVDEFQFIGAKEETIKLARILGIDVEA